MSACVGIELGARRIRAVRLEAWGRGRPRVAEIDWAPDQPAAAVRALQEQFGPAGRLALTLDLPLLFAQQVKLPPVTAAERRDVLRLEPERFFPVRSDEVVSAVRAADDLVFATREAPLARWVLALEELAPVDGIEPGPSALARALARGGIVQGVVLLDAGQDGIGIVEITAGRVTRARRVYGGPADVAAALAVEAVPGAVSLLPWCEERAHQLAAFLPRTTIERVPDVAGIAPPFLAAYGAALAAGRRRDLAETLVPPELGARIARRRRRELGFAAAAAAVTLVFAVWSVDAWRARSVRRLDAALAELRTRAAPALALQSRIEALAREGRAVAQIEAAQADPLGALLTLSERLPAGAYLRTLRASGSEWQIEGYAPSAAQLLAALGAAPQFKNVHFLSATTRAPIGDKTYESFALALRYVAAP